MLVARLGGRARSSPARSLGIAAVVSGTNTGAGLDRARRRPLRLRAPPARARRSRRPTISCFGGHLDSFWGDTPARVELHRGRRTTSACSRSRWRWLARHRAFAAGQTLSRDSTRGHRQASWRRSLPGSSSRSRARSLFFGHEVWTPSRLLWESASGVSRRLALGPAADDGAPAARRARAPGLGAQGAHDGGRSGTDRRLGRRRRDGRVLPRALDPSGRSRASAPSLRRRNTAASTERRPESSRSIRSATPTSTASGRASHGRPLLNGAPPDTPADYARLVLLDPANRARRSAVLSRRHRHRAPPGAHVDAEVRPRDPKPRQASSSSAVSRGARPSGRSSHQPAPALVTLPGGFAKPRDDPTGLHRLPADRRRQAWACSTSPRSSRASFDSSSTRSPPNGRRRTLRLADSKSEQHFASPARRRSRSSSRSRAVSRNCC